MLTLREREQTRQILIVDDEEETAEAISRLLETAGFTTATVDAGLAALKELQESPPDLLLLKPSLPDMDSVDLMRQVRERSTTPIIAVNADPNGVRTSSLIRLTAAILQGRSEPTLRGAYRFPKRWRSAAGANLEAQLGRGAAAADGRDDRIAAARPRPALELEVEG